MRLRAEVRYGLGWTDPRRLLLRVGVCHNDINTVFDPTIDKEV